jgi:non-heme chloroperoxidase
MNTAATLPIETRNTAAAAGSPVAGLGAAWRLLRNLSGASAAHTKRLVRLQPKAERTMQLRCHDGDTLSVHVTGAGRPIVLVHGMGGSHEEWARAAALLAREACVYRFDQRGHGERASAGADAHAHLQQMGADLALIIERLGLVQPILVGHSMGALTVMQYLRDHGAARIAGVCLIDQSPRITNDAGWSLGMFGSLSGTDLLGFIERLRGNFADTVIDEVVSRVSPRIAAACRQHRWIAGLLRRTLSRLSAASLIDMLQSLVECDFRDTLNALNLPALVVLGGRSGHYGGLPLAEYYAGALAGAEVCTYAMADHSPHRHEPARFVADLLAFAARRCPLEPQLA